MTVNEYAAMNASYLSKVVRTALYEGGVVYDAQKRSENKYVYDANGLVASSHVWVSPTPAAPATAYNVTTYLYDAQFRLIQTTAPLGRVTKLAYEADLGLYVASVTNPANQIESTIWDPKCSKPTAVIGANGDVTAFTYDIFCRETSKTHSSGGFERTSYFFRQGGVAQHVRVERPSADGAQNGNSWFDTYLTHQVADHVRPVTSRG